MTTPPRIDSTSHSPEGRRTLILSGSYKGAEGICLGRIAGTYRWAVSPDSSNAILELQFENEFALLLDLHAEPSVN